MVWRKAQESGAVLCNRGTDHHTVKDYFINNRDKTRRNIGNKLQLMHKHRIDADYKDDIAYDLKAEAKISIMHAEKVLELLENI